jgi:hypothetical protein
VDELQGERDLRGGRRERRVERSEMRGVALSLQLQACAERAGASAMVLADPDGLLVATSRCGACSSEEIASILPSLALGSDFAGLMMNRIPGGEQVVVSAFNVDGVDLYLCAVGDFSDRLHHEIAKAKMGVRRILLN